MACRGYRHYFRQTAGYCGWAYCLCCRCTTFRQESWEGCGGDNRSARRGEINHLTGKCNMHRAPLVNFRGHILRRRWCKFKLHRYRAATMPTIPQFILTSQWLSRGYLSAFAVYAKTTGSWAGELFSKTTLACPFASTSHNS